MFKTLMCGVLLTSSSLVAQQGGLPSGDYAGLLMNFRVKLHLFASQDGAMSCTVDSPDQGMANLPCSDVHLSGQTLSFSLPTIRGSWVGFASNNGATLSGTYSQGLVAPLNFARTGAVTGTQPPVMAASANTVASIPPAQPTSLPPSAPAPPPLATSGVRFDDGSKSITVPLANDVTVLFVGDDIKVQNYGHVNYVIKHKKGSLGRTLERSMEHRNASLGSTTGGGEEFLMEQGGLVYDSGMGGYSPQDSGLVLKAKQLSQAAVDATIAVRQTPGHEDFTPPGYDNLQVIAKYRLRSDGSR